MLYSKLLLPLKITRNFSSSNTSSPSADLVKPITVRTCVGIYDRLREITPRHYRNSPQEGLDLTVQYFDSANDPKRSRNSFTKTVVAVHGTYGYLTHFDRLISHFRENQQSVRVIVPNLPDFAHTRATKGAFWHSSVEKAAFLKDFLHKLEVDQIDCLLSHSMGIQTTAALWGDPEYSIPIKSVALFSPQSFWIDYNHKFDAMVHSLSIQNEFWYKLLELSRVHRHPYWPMKYDSINEFLLSASIFLDQRTAIDLIGRVEHLVTGTDRKVTFVHGAKDFLIKQSSTAELHRKFNLSPKDIIHCDPSQEENHEEWLGKIKSKRINSFIDTKGGHFAYIKQHKFSNKIIENLIGL